MTKQLDSIDRRLIASLRRNARQPLVALAREIGLSRSATQERLRRLEREGTILGYAARLRPGGEDGVRAWLLLVLDPGRSCDAVAPALAEHPEIRLVHSLSGAIDILALVETESIEALSVLRERMARMPGIARITTAPVLAEHLAPWGSLLPEA